MNQHSAHASTRTLLFLSGNQRNFVLLPNLWGEDAARVLLRHPRYSRHWEASQCLLVHLWGWKAALEGTHKASAIPGLNSGPQSPAAVPVTSIPCYPHSLAVLSAGGAARSSIKNKHPLNRTVPHYSSCGACPFPEAFAMRYELEVSPGPQMPVLVLSGKARGRTRSSGFQAEVL